MTKDGGNQNAYMSGPGAADFDEEGRVKPTAYGLPDPDDYNEEDDEAWWDNEVYGAYGDGQNNCWEDSPRSSDGVDEEAAQYLYRRNKAGAD